MEILGIGPMEFVLILIIALIILGPKEMVKAGQTFGRFARSVINSELWKGIRQTKQEFENLPTRLVREAGLEEEAEILKGDTQKLQSLGISIMSEASVVSPISESLPAQASTDVPQGLVSSNVVAPPGIMQIPPLNAINLPPE
jgi:Sec-independent protein translocase protein TatA